MTEISVVRNLGLCNIRIRFSSGSCMVRAGGQQETVPADALKTKFAKGLIEAGTLVVDSMAKTTSAKGKKPVKAAEEPAATTEDSNQ